jgi:hypothetical protein
MTVFQFRRADTAPLADPNVIAAAVLAHNTQPMSIDHGGDSLAENFRPADCNRNCLQGRICDCVPDIEDRQPSAKSDISEGFQIALWIVGVFALIAVVVGLLSLRLQTPIDKPAPASAPVAKVMT